MTTFPLVERPEARNQQKSWNDAFSIRRMLFHLRSRTSMRVLGYGAFALTSLLYASFYPVAKPALDRMDTLVWSR